MAYRLEQWTDSVYQIKQGRTKIGSVFQRDSDKKWVGRVKDDYVIADSPREAFQDIVRVLNRISICGVNNEEKARAALAARNAKIAAINAETMKDIQQLADICGIRLTSRRRRPRKILL